MENFGFDKMEAEKEELKVKLKEYSDTCLGDLVPLDKIEPQFRMAQPAGTNHLTPKLINYSDKCVRRKLTAYALVIELAERQCQSSSWLRRSSKLTNYPRVRCQLHKK